MREEENSSEQEAVEISIKQTRHTSSEPMIHKKISKPKVQPRKPNRPHLSQLISQTIEDAKLLKELEKRPVDLGPAPTKSIVIQDTSQKARPVEGVGAQVVRVLKKERRTAPDTRLALLNRSQHLRKHPQNLVLLKKKQSLK